MTKPEYLNRRQLSFQRGTPNKILATYFQTVLDSIDYANNLNINLEAHRAFLEDEHACIVEKPHATAEISSLASSSNLSSSIEILIDVISIDRFLKRTDSNPSVPPLHNNYII